MTSFKCVHFNEVIINHVGTDYSSDGNGRMKIASIISQLLIYNTYCGTHRATTTTNVRHRKQRETHLPLYEGLKMHGDGRQKKQIDNAHALGLSVFYYRVMEVNMLLVEQCASSMLKMKLLCQLIYDTMSLSQMMWTT